MGVGGGSLFGEIDKMLANIFFDASFVLTTGRGKRLFKDRALVIIITLLLLFIPLFLCIEGLRSGVGSHSSQVVGRGTTLRDLGGRVDSQGRRIGAHGRRLSSQGGSLRKRVRRRRRECQILQRRGSSLTGTGDSLIQGGGRLRLIVSALGGGGGRLRRLVMAGVGRGSVVRHRTTSGLTRTRGHLGSTRDVGSGFFVRAVRRVHAPLSLILNSLTLIIRGSSPRGSVSARLLSTCHGALTVRSLTSRLVNARHSGSITGCLHVTHCSVIRVTHRVYSVFIS